MSADRLGKWLAFAWVFLLVRPILYALGLLLLVMFLLNCGRGKEPCTTPDCGSTSGTPQPVLTGTAGRTVLPTSPCGEGLVCVTVTPVATPTPVSPTPIPRYSIVQMPVAYSNAPAQWSAKEVAEYGSLVSYLLKIFSFGKVELAQVAAPVWTSNLPMPNTCGGAWSSEALKAANAQGLYGRTSVWWSPIRACGVQARSWILIPGQSTTQRYETILIHEYGHAGLGLDHTHSGACPQPCDPDTMRTADYGGGDWMGRTYNQTTDDYDYLIAPQAWAARWIDRPTELVGKVRLASVNGVGTKAVTLKLDSRWTLYVEWRDWIGRYVISLRGPSPYVPDDNNGVGIFYLQQWKPGQEWRHVSGKGVKLGAGGLVEPIG